MPPIANGKHVQAAVTELVIGLRFAASGARRLARLLKGHVCEESAVYCSQCFLEEYARGTPFTIDLLRGVETDLTPRENARIRDIQTTLRVLMESLVTSAEASPPVTVAAAVEEEVQP